MPTPYRRYTVFLAVLIGLGCCFEPLLAQRQSEYWYFGARAGLWFNGSTPVPLANSAMSTGEGCAVQCDAKTGDLMFYTDGQTVYTRLHQPMPNGTELNGDYSTSQSALIVPSPANSSKFFIFNPAAITTTDLRGRCYCLYYSVVDMNRNNGLGEVIVKNELVSSDITEHLTGISNCQGSGYWVVVRSSKSRHFYAYQIIDDRILLDPVISDAGQPTISLDAMGQMHISPNGKKLIITSYKGYSLLYDFDAATGLVTNGVNLFEPETRPAHYGAAFSLDGSKVYIAESGTTPDVQATIYQFGTSLPTPRAIQESRAAVASVAGSPEWTPLQLAVDGRIYVAKPRTNKLAVLSEINRSADSVVFQDNAITLSGECRNGLPNIIGSFLGPVMPPSSACVAPLANFDVPRGCEGSCLSFRNTSQGRVDSYLWTFQGAHITSSIARDPLGICYYTPGIFTVTLTVTNAFGSHTVSKQIAIYPKPTVTIENVDEVCPGSTVRLYVSGAKDYVWSPQADMSDHLSSAPSITPRTTTTYRVIGTNTDGCSDTAAITVRVRRMSASPDMVVCRGAEVKLYADGADHYHWSPALYLDDPTSATPLSHPTESIDYIVRMESDSCLVYDTVRITVVDTFQVSVSGPPSICPGQSVTPRVVGGTTFQWWPTTGISDPTSATPVITPSGTTTYMVRASSGSCFDTASYTVVVNPVPAVYLPSDIAVCSGDSISLLAKVDIPNGYTGNYSLAWVSSASVVVDTGHTIAARIWQTTTYHVTLTTDDGCSTSDTITVSVAPSPFIDAGMDKATCDGSPVRVFVSGNALEYSWRPTLGVSNPSSSAPYLTPPVTTTYIVIGRTGSCEVYDTLTIYVNPQKVALSPDTTICMGESVQLMATGAAHYRWSPAEGLSDPTIPNPLARPTVTTSYAVHAIDAYGCESDAQVRVTVNEITPIRLVVGTANAAAGSADARVPIYVEIDPGMLPLSVDSMTVELICDVSVFMPYGMDNGTILPSTRGTKKIIRLKFNAFTIVQARQKLTEVFGLAMVGATQMADFSLEYMKWYGISCPVTSTISGTLFIYGCNIQSRLIREFSSTRLEVMPDPVNGIIAINMTGNTPGEHTVRIIRLDGSLVYEQSITPFGPLGLEASTTPGSASMLLDLGAIASGMYYMTVSSPYFIETIPIGWTR